MTFSPLLKMQTIATIALKGMARARPKPTAPNSQEQLTQYSFTPLRISTPV